VTVVAPDGSSAIIMDDALTLRRILIPSGAIAGTLASNVNVAPLQPGALDRLRRMIGANPETRAWPTETLEWERVEATSDDATRAIVKTSDPFGRKLVVDFSQGAASPLPGYKYLRKISLSPRGNFVLVNEELDGLAVLEARTGSRLWSIIGKGCKTAVSPDDRLIAISWGNTEKAGTLFFHDMQTGKPVGSVPVEAESVTPLGFSSSTDRLMVRAKSASGQAAQPTYSTLLIDIATETVIAKHTGLFVHEVSSAQVDQGLLLECVEIPRVLRVINMLRRTTLDLIPTYPGSWHSAHVGPAGQVVFTVEIEQRRHSRRHTEVASATNANGRFDLDGSFHRLHRQQSIAITSNTDPGGAGGIRLWQLEHLRADVLGRCLVLESSVRAIASHGDSSVAVAYHNNLYQGLASIPAQALAALPSGEELIKMMPPSVRDEDLGLFDLVHGDETWRVRCGDKPAQMCFDPAGRYLAMGTSVGTEIRRVVDGSIAVVVERAIGTRAMAYDTAGRQLALADEVAIATYDTDPGAPAGWKVAECPHVESIAFDGDGRMLAAATRDSWRAWSQCGADYTGVLLRPRIQRLDTGQLVAIGYRDNMVVIVDIPSGKLRASFDARGSAALSSDGRTLVVCDGGVLKIVDCCTMEIQARLEGPRGNLAFGSDARWLHESTKDVTARVWDLSACCLAFEAELGHNDAYHIVSDGKRLLWWAQETLNWVAFDPDELIRLATTRIIRPLDKFQWAEVMPELAFDPVQPVPPIAK
jgi:WD40 repeat protein